jgi:hypothetical protein
MVLLAPDGEAFLPDLPQYKFIIPPGSWQLHASRNPDPTPKNATCLDVGNLCRLDHAYWSHLHEVHFIFSCLKSANKNRLKIEKKDIKIC